MMRQWKRWMSAALVSVMTLGSAVPVSAEEVSAAALEALPDSTRELQLKFDGDLADTSGKQIAARLNGEASWVDGQNIQNDENDKALSFNGADNYIDLGTDTSLQPKSLTTSFWMKASEKLSGEQMLVWNKADGNFRGDGWYLSSLNDETPLILSVGGTENWPTELKITGDREEFFPVNEWVHIAVTYDSATKKAAMYRNGVKQVLNSETGNDEINAVENEHKYLGFNSPGYNTSYIKLALDDFEIYSQAATAEQVWKLYDPEAKITDEQIVADDKAALNPFDGINTGAVTDDIELPVTGEYGSTITWVSSNANVISETGDVTRPAKDTKVTLTARIVKGTAEDTKQFQLTVKAKPQPTGEEQLWVSYDMTVENGMLKDQMGHYDAALSNMNEKNVVTGINGAKALKFTGDKSQYVKIPAGILENGTEDFTVTVGFQTFQQAYSWVFNLGTKDTQNYVFLNPIRSNGDMAFTIKANGQGEKSVSGNYITPGEETVATMVFHKDSTAEIYINGKRVGTVNHGYSIADIIKNGVSNPSDAIGYMGLSLYEWDPGFIGTISRFDVYNYTLTEDEIWTDYYERYLNISDKERVDRDLNALALESGYLTTTDKLDLPTKGAYGSTIEWKSSNETVIATDGTVNYPEKGEPDQTVELKATVSYGAVRKTVTYTMILMAETDTVDIQDFALGAVDVTDAYYDNASQKDIEFLKKFDPDRLLVRFRETAGLDTKGKSPYGGWEGTLIAGHTLGHYLSACAQAYVTADNENDREWMFNTIKYLIDELKVCQDALGNGFIFGAAFSGSNPEHNIYDQFDRIENGITAETWVPWYTIHKIMSGLVDVYKYTRYDNAKTVAGSLGDWVYNRSKDWSKETQNNVLRVEYGGMNDCLYELYKITGKDEHAMAAHMFDEDALFENVLTGNPSSVSGRHANTTIPKFVGALNRYRTMQGKTVNGEVVDASRYLEYAEAFWEIVVNHHSYITGGNSQWEHFREADALDVQRTQCNCETCNTYNMLKLSRELYKITGLRKYADYYENTFINAIMSSINPENGTTAYFQPMATGYHKVFGNADPADNTFWCCTGSGMENFTKLSDSIYYYKEGADAKVIVNQYVSSVLDWKVKKVKLTQTASMPEKDVAAFTVNLTGGQASETFTLSLRVPDWTAGSPQVKINGQTSEVVVSGGYAQIKRAWKDNDKVEVTLPMDVEAYSLPDDNTVYGFKYGPVVLSAELGTDEEMVNRSYCGWGVALPAGKRVFEETASPKDGARQVLSSETLQIGAQTTEDYIAGINDNMIRKDKEDGALAFELQGVNRDLTFSTHYKQYQQRYGIYWYFAGTDAEVEDEDAILAKKLEGRDARVKGDVVKPGYPQYETDSLHMLKESASVGGVDEELGGVTTRYAGAGGYFEYRMAVDKNEKNYVLCKLAKADNGKTLKLTVDGQVIYEEVLNYVKADKIYEKKIEIPAELIEKAASVTITENEQENTYDTVQLKVEGAAGEASARLVSELYITTGYSNDAGLTEVTAQPGSVQAGEEEYVITVPEGTEKTSLNFKLADTYGLLYIDDVLVNDAKAQEIVLTGEETVVPVLVYAEDHETAKEYTIRIVTGQQQKLPYVDVTEKDWWYDAVAYNYYAGTMTGKDKTHFAPAEDLKRAQFAAVLYKMNKSPAVEFEEAFPDVPAEAWCADCVTWALNHEIVTGYTDTNTFRPDNPVTRAELATMLYRYAKNFKKYDVSVSGDCSAFPDAKDVQEFAQDAMNWAVSEGIITGKTVNEQLMLYPNGKANRAECATMIQRYMELYEK